MFLHRPTHKTITNLIGLAIIALALTLGAILGTLTNHPTTANATTPDTTICGAICAHTTTGHGGNHPASPLTTTGHGGNHH